MPRTLIETTAAFRRYRVTDAQGKVIGEDLESIPTPAQANADAIQKAAASALATNRAIVSGADTYLAVTSPSAAQVAAQTRSLTQAAKALSQQNTALIRMVLGLLDGTD